MAHEIPTVPKSPPPLLLLRIVILFFLMGGAGALCGIRLIMAIHGEAFQQGGCEGVVLLLVSACVGVPGIFVLRKDKAF